jgi:hypothetical protein
MGEFGTQAPRWCVRRATIGREMRKYLREGVTIWADKWRNTGVDQYSNSNTEGR